MIQLADAIKEKVIVNFLEKFPHGFDNKKESLFICETDGTMRLLIKWENAHADLREVKEAVVKAVKELRDTGISEYVVNIEPFLHAFGIGVIREVVLGIYLGEYKITLPTEERKVGYHAYLAGVAKEQKEAADRELSYGLSVAESVIWAMDLVNAPGNMLRPMDFAREIMQKTKNTDITCELIVKNELEQMGMNAMLQLGGGEENPPCFLVIRYKGDKTCKTVTGLIGKGVTCDTGGYCLKSASSMKGIKGDMAGGAAVAGAIVALAENKIQANVTGFIPMCENRIGTVSLVPGDVITSYSGKRIEICNTDAEGRLILADAMSYAVENESVDCVIDIATLTGAVVNMLGFSTAGALTDNETFFERFINAAKMGGERYWRLPIFEEQRNMIKSQIADIKNMGESHCGTISAGLFIQAFANQKPWIHLDIAGTAWVDTPLFSGQPKGATGAGVTSLYYMFEERK